MYWWQNTHFIGVSLRQWHLLQNQKCMNYSCNKLFSSFLLQNLLYILLNVGHFIGGKSSLKMISRQGKEPLMLVATVVIKRKQKQCNTSWTKRLWWLFLIIWKYYQLRNFIYSIYSTLLLLTDWKWLYCNSSL